MSVEPGFVLVPVGTAVDFFSSLGVGVEKAAYHQALSWDGPSGCAGMLGEGIWYLSGKAPQASSGVKMEAGPIW